MEPKDAMIVAQFHAGPIDKADNSKPGTTDNGEACTQLEVQD